MPSVVCQVSLVFWSIPYLGILINFLSVEKTTDYLRTAFKRDLITLQLYAKPNTWILSVFALNPISKRKLLIGALVVAIGI